MGLEKLIEKEMSKTRVSLSNNRDRALDYLMKYELKDYFSGEDGERNKDILRDKLEDSFNKYQSELSGMLRKTASKGTMWTDVANQIYGYVSKTPISYVTGLSTALFAGKTLTEIPAIYRYLKKSKDFYGIGKYLGLKTLRWLTPVVGPALESGAFERMIRRRVVEETKKEFLKDIGRYNSSEDYFNKKMKQPIGKVLYLPDNLKEAA